MNYPYNPAHPCGTCADCGEEMVHNVPRMGAAGGFVHKATGQLQCGPRVEPTITVHCAECDKLAAALQSAKDEAERARGELAETRAKRDEYDDGQAHWFNEHFKLRVERDALSAECEALRADKARPLVELMRAYEILHAFMSTEQIQQGGTFHLNKTDGSGSNRAISNAEAFSLISRFYNSDERATNAMRDLKAGNFKCISVDSAMVEYWPIARADAARKEQT